MHRPHELRHARLLLGRTLLALLHQETLYGREVLGEEAIQARQQIPLRLLLARGLLGCKKRGDSGR